MIPVHMKYLLLVANEGKDIFSSKDTTLINSLPDGVINSELKNEITGYWSELVTRVNLTEGQKKIDFKVS